MSHSCIEGVRFIGPRREVSRYRILASKGRDGERLLGWEGRQIH